VRVEGRERAGGHPQLLRSLFVAQCRPIAEQAPLICLLHYHFLLRRLHHHHRRCRFSVSLVVLVFVVVVVVVSWACTGCPGTFVPR